MKYRWPLLLFATGFCGMIYELAFAQLLTAIFGGAFESFATTLGVYVAGLGLGSLSFKPDTDRDEAHLLFRAEIALAGFGLITPVAFVLLQSLSISSVTASLNHTTMLLATHAVIFATGFLSGLELPILTSLARRSGRSHADDVVLGFDYLGMFAATLAFPLFLFPQFGLIASFATAAALNLFAAALTLALMSKPSRTALWAFSIVVVLNLGALVLSPSIQTYMTSIYAP